MRSTSLPFSFFRIVLGFCLVSILGSCGGGGGGGTGDGQNDRDGIRLIHGAIERSPFDVFVVGVPETLESARFAGESFYRSVPRGPIALQLVTSNRPSDVKASVNLDFTSGARHTIFVADSNGLSTKLLNDDPGALEAGQGAIRFLHGTIGASTLLFRLSDGKTPVSVPFGDASSYKILVPGSYDFTVIREADGRALGSGSVVIEEGQAQSLLFAGDVSIFVTASVFSDR